MEADYAPTSLLAPPDFQTFRRPCKSWSNELQYFLDKKLSQKIAPKNQKLALELGTQTYQILTNDDEVFLVFS